MSASRRLLATRALTLADAALALQAGYLLALLLAGSRSRPLPGTGAAPTHRLLVLVPAHDEENGLAPTVSALLAQDYPAPLFEVVVVADNCTDRTADVAREAGAQVWERTAPDDRGKGAALAWAVERVLAEGSWDGVVVVDADCVATAGLLRAFARQLAAGADGVQARYDVSNPEASWSAALRYAGMALFNTVRLHGKASLGASAGLSGTGMCLGTGLLTSVPWASRSITEDLEQHARLVAAGHRIAFVAEERVLSPMPVTRSQARGQEARWEAGRAQVARRHGLPLLRAGLRTRRPSMVVEGLDVLTVPHSAWAAAFAGAAAGTALARDRRGSALLAVAAAAETAYVLGGLRQVGAPRPVYVALLRAPLLVASKLPLLVRAAVGTGPTTWERRQR